MSDKDSIFGSTPDSPDQGNEVASNQQEVNKAEASNVNPWADKLQAIKTEDGRPKYASVDDALNGLEHSQSHISKLESENNEMRELIKAMEERMLSEQRHLENQRTQQEAALDENQVAELVNRTLSQRENQAVQQKNVQTVVSTLTEKFGSKEAAEQAYMTKAQEMGINMEMMNSLAMSSPNAVLAYFGSTGASAPRKTEGTINTAGMREQPASRGKNPLLTGSIKDMQSEVERIKRELGY